MHRKLPGVPVFAALCALSVAGCVSAPPPGSAAVREVTFSSLQPLYVEAASVDVSTTYVAGVDSRDVSEQFATPPAVAIVRYANSRFKPGGTEGVFRFVIEDASIFHTLAKPENSFIQWMGIGNHDQYEMRVRLRMFMDRGIAQAGPSIMLTFNRTMSVDEGASLNQRAQAQNDFLRAFVSYMDREITDTLYRRMNTVSPGDHRIPQDVGIIQPPPVTTAH